MTRHRLLPGLLAAMMASGEAVHLGSPQQTSKDFRPSARVRSHMPKSKTGGRERARRRRQIERGTLKPTEVSDG